jgi:hypothetical protein
MEGRQRCCYNLSTALGCNKPSHHHGQRDQQREHARVAVWLLHPTRTYARAPAHKHNTAVEHNTADPAQLLLQPSGLHPKVAGVYASS